MNKIILLLSVLLGGVTTFAQQTNFNVLAPKAQETLMKLEAFTNMDAPIEYHNIGTVPIIIGVSNSEGTWSPQGNTLEIQPLSSITFTISELTNQAEGFLAAYNNSLLISGTGVMEAGVFSPLCGVEVPGEIGDLTVEFDAPGVWNSGLNLLYSCPKTNVGIGTDEPIARLEIKTNGTTNPALLYRSNTPVIITDDGKLGIGTTLPEAKIEIQKSSEVPFLYNHDTNPLTITQEGLLGIGTTLPEAPIHISSNSINADDKLMIVGDYASTTNPKGFVVYQDGRIFSREVQVTINAFPDYVFEEDYSLMPLNQLEEYIKENGHLPNIPSAKEVEDNNGEVNLGEMNRILLEKVEELTLYIIELEKRIER